MDSNDLITFLMVIIAVLMGIISGFSTAWISRYMGSYQTVRLGTGLGSFAPVPG